MGTLRKLMALAWTLTMVLVVALSIEWDQDLQDHLSKRDAWADYFHKWHDVPAFGPDGRWNVERNFDHAAHYKWQMEEIKRLRANDLHDPIATCEVTHD